MRRLMLRNVGLTYYRVGNFYENQKPINAKGNGERQRQGDFHVTRKIGCLRVRGFKNGEVLEKKIRVETLEKTKSHVFGLKVFDSITLFLALRLCGICKETGNQVLLMI